MSNNTEMRCISCGNYIQMTYTRRNTLDSKTFKCASCNSKIKKASSSLMESFVTCKEFISLKNELEAHYTEYRIIHKDPKILEKKWIDVLSNNYIKDFEFVVENTDNGILTIDKIKIKSIPLLGIVDLVINIKTN